MKKHFLLQCQKNLIKEEQEIEIIRNYHRFSAQKQAKINKTSLPPPNFMPCLESKQQKKSQHKEQCFIQQPATQPQKDTNKWIWNFSPRQGHRHSQSRKQLPLTGTWRVFFYSFHLFSDLQGFLHQLIAMELNHMAIKPVIFHFSDFSFPAFSNMTPKGRVPVIVVRNARDKREC